MSAVSPLRPATGALRDTLAQQLFSVRCRSRELAAPLSPEDCQIQSMPDASPTKWHLAHTTWFFETFVLAVHVPGYRQFDDAFGYLFNSYYNSVGAMHPRPQRGLVTRPTLADVLAYRDHVDAALETLVCGDDYPAAVGELLTLGMHHEQQHQELLLTDIKHAFSMNPLLPAYQPRALTPSPAAGETSWVTFDEAIVETGTTAGFAFDNERPRHRSLLTPYALAQRPVSNADYAAFIADGGYRTPTLWLSDGWARVQAENWTRPLYWQADADTVFTLHGVQPLDPAAPVCHVSYYEADAFARWAGARLPREAEWEHAAAGCPVTGQFVEGGVLQPAACRSDDAAFEHLFGGVWEWTQSPYVGYPGYAPPSGAVGEYNGKFMSDQWVLRGGSCASPQSHLRASYRNFFPAGARWQFSGLRLARDC